MAERHTLWEYFVASVGLLVVLGGLAALAWYAGRHQEKQATPRHLCPYCGREIEVRLETDGKEKRP